MNKQNEEVGNETSMSPVNAVVGKETPTDEKVSC